VVQGIRPKGAMNGVMIGALPFVLAMFAMVALLLRFPGIAFWIPSLVY
jgi:TRAP-type C4-dicarboxylate transport system permease large subunit